jgi:hypothetical protein
MKKILNDKQDEGPGNNHEEIEMKFMEDDRSKEDTITLDDVMERLPFGRYQVWLCVAIYLFFISGGLINYNWGFFLLNPETEGEQASVPKLYMCEPINMTQPFPCSF